MKQSTWTSSLEFIKNALFVQTNLLFFWTKLFLRFFIRAHRIVKPTATLNPPPPSPTRWTSDPLSSSLCSSPRRSYPLLPLRGGSPAISSGGWAGKRRSRCSPKTTIAALRWSRARTRSSQRREAAKTAKWSARKTRKPTYASPCAQVRVCSLLRYEPWLIITLTTRVFVVGFVCSCRQCTRSHCSLLWDSDADCILFPMCSCGCENCTT